MKTPVRTLLIGIGRMGKNHERVLTGDARFEIVARVDRSDAFPAPETFDVAVCAASTTAHYTIGKRLLEMGKPVLMEKPLASEFPQARELVELAKARGLLLAVGHLERMNPAILKAREILQAGRLGTPIHFAFTRAGRYPDGATPTDNVIVDLAVHDFDVLRFLTPGLTWAVESRLTQSVRQEGVIDLAELLCRAGTDKSASLHVNWHTPSRLRTLRITGTEGVLFVDYIAQTCELAGGEALPVERVEPLQAQLDQLSLALQGKPHALCLGADALEAVRLANL